MSAPSLSETISGESVRLPSGSAWLVALPDSTGPAVATSLTGLLPSILTPTELKSAKSMLPA
jgi:hypothetical protein